jgi:hypothetical protein
LGQFGPNFLGFDQGTKPFEDFQGAGEIIARVSPPALSFVESSACDQSQRQLVFRLDTVKN